MKSYTIHKKMASFDWEQIPKAHMENLPWLEATEISAAAQLCYDETALYVRLTAIEKQIRAELTGPLELPCLDSCLEFFFSPIRSDVRYLNMEYNPNGCMYLGIGSGQDDHVRLIPDNKRKWLCEPEIERTQEGWSIAWQIPEDFIRLFFPEFVLQSGRKMRGNFYKCGELTAHPHYLAWNPVTSEKPDFHRPCDFGELVLE